MKGKWISATVVLLAVAIGAPALFAAREGGGRPEQGQSVMGGHRAGAGGGFLRSLDLTEEQQEAVKEIMADAREKAEDAEDREARREIMREAFGKIKQEVLTDAQREKLEKMWKHSPSYGRPWGVFKALKLTDEQREEMKEILDAAREQAQDVEDPQARRKIMGEAFGKVKQDVLTDKQREKLAKMWKHHAQGRPQWGEGQGSAGRGMFRSLDLTEEQREAIREIMEEAREKILNEVLTAEQREKLEELRERAPRRQGGQREGKSFKGRE